jgi:hypothetical protein
MDPLRRRVTCVALGTRRACPSSGGGVSWTELVPPHIIRASSRGAARRGSGRKSGVLSVVGRIRYGHSSGIQCSGLTAERKVGSDTRALSKVQAQLSH